MTTYQPYLDFTAQSKTVGALMGLYAQLEKRDMTKSELLPFVVFMAFSIEAYLNSIGSRKIAFWDDLERLPWRTKVSVLHKHAGKRLDWGGEPIQFAVEVFQIRDHLAHGKPVRVTGPKFVDPAEADALLTSGHLQPDWYRKLNNDWVRQGKEKFRRLMTYLGALYGLHESDHLLSSQGGFLTE